MEEIIYSNIQSKPAIGGVTTWQTTACAVPGCESGAYGDLGQFYQGESCTNPGQGVYIPCLGGFTSPQSCVYWINIGNNCETGYHISDRPLGYTTQQYADSGYCSVNDFVISVLGYDTWSGLDNTIRLPCVQN